MTASQALLQDVDAKAQGLRSASSAPTLCASSSSAPIAARLEEMIALDQVIRSFVMKVGALPSAQQADTMSALGARMRAVDLAHTEELKAFIALKGWPTRSEYGARAAHNAWLLVQHADHDLAIQQQVLAMMEPLLKTGEVLKSCYAYLWDRVATNRGAEQRYGTQGRCVSKGVWEPHPMEAPEQLEQRRALMGLCSMADYKARFKTLCA